MRGRSSAVAMIVALGLLAPLVARGAETNAYTTAISPAAVPPSSPATYTITLANEGTSPKRARQARIAIPTGFSIDPSVKAKTSAAGDCSAADWEVHLTDLRILATSPDDAHALCPGGVLTVGFQATAPAHQDLYTWETRLRRQPGSNSNLFELHGSQPTVLVDGAPPPPPSIGGGPANPTNQRSASFVFSDSAAGLDFSCKLDGGEFAPCTSPVTYADLGDGAHMFAVRATDAASNTGAPSTYGWTIDTVAPNTAISSGPPAASSSASASFTFTSTEDRSSFSCSVDGGAFATCVSPQTYRSLANDQHAFGVRAADAAGNTDPSPASFAWTIATRGPSRVDQTPPRKVTKVAKSVRYRLLKLRWRPPSDHDFHHVVVAVAKSPTRPPTKPVYRGAGTSYTNSRFRNGFYYRYAITSFDRAGNASRRVAVVVPADVLLTAPRAGARLRKPPPLDWASVPKATYYNVQLYLGSKKVLSAWPGRSRLQLERTWLYESGVYVLRKGKYRWYVWPGFGPRSQVRYGQLLGQASFDFAG